MSCPINIVYLCHPETDIARHIMKNRLFILFSALALSANAENISEDAARGMALDFFKNNSPQTSVSNLQMVYDGETPQTRADGSAPALYVFDNPQGKGFFIISGDDIAQPLLGYSYDNDFPKENLPVHIQGWLESLKTQINDGRKYGVEAPPTSHALTRAGQTVVKLQTAQWGQDAPFNNKCPFIGWNSTQAPSGCVITATAIVMRYHKWPSYGHGTVPGYTTATNKINRPSVTLGHYYDWEGMPNKYTNGSYTIEQANQVAQLMVDLGTMFEADYTSDATSAFTDDIAYNLSTYMDYDKSALYRERYQYTDEEWHPYWRMNSSRDVLSSIGEPICMPDTPSCSTDTPPTVTIVSIGGGTDIATDGSYSMPCARAEAERVETMTIIISDKEQSPT